MCHRAKGKPKQGHTGQGLESSAWAERKPEPSEQVAGSCPLVSTLLILCHHLQGSRAYRGHHRGVPVGKGLQQELVTKEVPPSLNHNLFKWAGTMHRAASTVQTGV